MIPVPSGVRVWLAVGCTDMRRGMNGLALQVQQALGRDPHAGDFGPVARMLGEDEDWLFELSINMFPEDGCFHVYGGGEDGVTAFTQYGIECLKQIIADETGNVPPAAKPTE